MDKKIAIRRIVSIKYQISDLKQFAGKARILTDLNGRLNKLRMYKYPSKTIAIFVKESERELTEAMDLESKKYNKNQNSQDVKQHKDRRME